MLAASVAVTVVCGVLASIVHVCGGRFMGCRGKREEEINLAALEHCVRRDDDNIRDHAIVGGRGGYLEDVLRVSLHDLAGHDGAADLFNVAI
ncbi:hypothetical protein F3Y22_tig00110407pilonHSYRG00072 [Hibiscus syriacus]|uniref:Secreted protein n=1 Tax=Hibiscus syriacus TaxID=106335 RepID=A0A6A3AQJ8_HIBSY|nr:hypothetical protein F3Y22_tig00110407pilonHSYRG00072 [Hibiscus syriacus]